RRKLVEQAFECRPQFSAVGAPAAEFRGVGRDKRRRRGVLGFGREDFEQSLASAFGRAEQYVHECAVARVTHVEGNRLQAREADGLQYFRGGGREGVRGAAFLL